jgi:hypothetical protein
MDAVRAMPSVGNEGQGMTSEFKLIEYMDQGKKICVTAKVLVLVDDDGMIVKSNANYPELVGQGIVGFKQKEVSQ